MHVISDHARVDQRDPGGYENENIGIPATIGSSQSSDVADVPVG